MEFDARSLPEIENGQLVIRNVEPPAKIQPLQLADERSDTPASKTAEREETASQQQKR
jgi:hypothetical protein